MGSFAESLELKLPWLHGPNRPLYNFDGLIIMTVLYIVVISVLSFFMRHRRATEKKLLKQEAELKKLQIEANTNESLKEKYETMQKDYQAAKKDYKPFNINFITIPHNFIMCLYSLYAFVGALFVMIENNKTAPLSTLICDKEEKQQRGMEYWFYTFYLSKFVEYLDTIFLIIKAKGIMPPENSQYFLHIYHHAVTAAIVWSCMHYHFSTSWTGPVTNAFVHILMYGYYFLAECNLIDRRLGGKFITPIQLIQFVFCIVLAVIETIWNFISNGGCGTNINVVIFMFTNYAIFLSFFVKVYLDKKTERTSTQRRR